MGILEDLLSRITPGEFPTAPFDDAAPIKFGALGAGGDLASLLRGKPKEVDGAATPTTEMSSANQQPAPAVPMAIPQPAAAPPAPAVAPAQMPTPAPAPEQQPSIFGRLMNGLHDNSNTLLALGAGFAGAPNAGQGISRAAASAIPASQQDLKNKMLLQGQNQTYNALIKRGVPDDVARAAMQNPEILKQVLPSVFGSKEYGFQMTPDGTLLKTDKGTGTVSPAYQTAPKLTHQTLPDGTVLEIDPTGKTPPKPVYQSNKPQFSVIGKDVAGNDIHGFVDPTTKQVFDTSGKPIAEAGAAGGALGLPRDAEGQPLQGQDLLAHLEKSDPVTAAQVKAIIRGDSSVTSRNLQKYQPIANLVDPTLQQFNYDVRKKTALDYSSSGKSGLNVKSLETVGGHLEKLMNSYDKLGNTWQPEFNTFKNWLAVRGGQGAPGAFETNATGVANELGTVFRSFGMSDSEVKSWRDRISSSAGPDQFKDNMGVLLDMLKTRREVIADGHKNGGLGEFPVERFKKLDSAIGMIETKLFKPPADASPTGAPAAPTPAPAAPITVKTLDEARALKPGTRFIDPNGVERTR